MSRTSSKLAASVSKVRKQPAAHEAAKRTPVATAPSPVVREASQAVRATRSKGISELHPSRVWPD